MLAVLFGHKVLTADRVIHQLRLDVLPTESAPGRIYRVWEPTRPEFIELDGTLRGYSYVFLVNGSADHDGFCFAYAKPHEKGDRVRIEHLVGDPSISRIEGYYLNPYIPEYWFLLGQACFIFLFVAYFEFKRRRFVRFLETTDTADGDIEEIKRVGWRSWQVTVGFPHQGTNHSLETVVRASSEQEARELESAFGNLTVAVRPNKPKKSLVIEFLGA